MSPITGTGEAGKIFPFCVPGGFCGLPILLLILCSHITETQPLRLLSSSMPCMHRQKVHPIPTDPLPRFPKSPFPSLTKVTSRPEHEATSQLNPSFATIVIAFRAERQMLVPAQKDARLAPTMEAVGYLCGARNCGARNSFVSLANLRCLRRPKLARGEVLESLSNSGMPCHKRFCSVMLGLNTHYCHHSYWSPSPWCGARQAL